MRCSSCDSSARDWNPVDLRGPEGAQEPQCECCIDLHCWEHGDLREVLRIERARVWMYMLKVRELAAAIEADNRLKRIRDDVDALAHLRGARWMLKDQADEIGKRICGIHVECEEPEMVGA